MFSLNCVFALKEVIAFKNKAIRVIDYPFFLFFLIDCLLTIFDTMLHKGNPEDFIGHVRGYRGNQENVQVVINFDSKTLRRLRRNKFIKNG